MEDNEAGDTDGADADWFVSIKERLDRNEAEGGRGGLREAYGEDPSQDEFLRLTGSQTPENGYWLDQLTLH